MRQPATELRLVSSAILAPAGILTLLAGLLLAVRLLLIQYLYILIIIIIICLLALGLEAADSHPLQPSASISRALELVSRARYWTGCSINVVVGGRGLTSSQITCGAQSGTLMVHQTLLLSDIH